MEQKVIRPYHLFQHQGGWFVLNIERMSASTLEETTAEAIKKLPSGSDAPLDPLVEEQLEKLGLLSAGGMKTPKVKIETEKVPIPVVNICLFLTQSCNLNCVYCYGDGGGYGSGGNMEEKTAFQAVDWMLEQAGKIKKLHIGFFGGEPLLNFPLMKAVAEYAERRVQECGKEVGFNMTTNATLLDDEKIAFIVEHKVAALVSFDGTKELQDAQRPYANGQGSYDATVPKIKKLLEALPETPANAVIVGDTDPEIVKDALRKIGFSNVSIMPASQSLFAGEPDKTKEARDTLHLVQGLEKEAETWLRLTKSRDSEGLKSLKEKSGLALGLLSLLHNSKRAHYCGAGLGMVGVSVAGDIYLCHRFVGRDEYKLGSIFAKGLDREKYQKSPVTESKECAACFAKYYCAGGCKHDNAGACGSTTTPSEDICRLRRRELELAATVISRLDPEDVDFLVEYEIAPPKPCPLDF